MTYAWRWQLTRGEGTTSAQMRDAPVGGVYIWCNGRLDYPRALAAHLGRGDLHIVDPDALRWGGERLRGRRCTGYTLDHAADINAEQRDTLIELSRTVRP